MPLIHVKVIEGVFEHAQKQQMIQKITDAMTSVTGENLRSLTWVVVEEVKSGHWGVGGSAITSADAKALAAGKAPA